MILIVSESSDQSTSNVIDWLRFYENKYMRINENDVIKIQDIDMNCSLNPSISFSINDKTQIINTDQITAYWFRRGFFNFFDIHHVAFKLEDKKIENEIKRNLRSEIARIGDLFQFIIEKKTKIGSSYTATNNKLIHQSIAQSIGIVVPESLICTSKGRLIEFYKKHPSGIITKPISDTFSIIDHSHYYNLYTNIITSQDIETFPDCFHPTLIQQRIEKKCELRVFFLKGKFYTMAIFSQNDDKTRIDFRKYNKEKQNYRVPFDLPAEIKRKIKRFMRLTDLDCGSIDLLYSTEGKYYFLEVNPVGQFGMVSYPCNYQLEKNIALELMK
jgi:ATP-GRASP peptide maturase of grasp-with-spasm system